MTARGYRAGGSCGHESFAAAPAPRRAVTVQQTAGRLRHLVGRRGRRIRRYAGSAPPTTAANACCCKRASNGLGWQSARHRGPRLWGGRPARFRRISSGPGADASCDYGQGRIRGGVRIHHSAIQALSRRCSPATMRWPPAGPLLLARLAREVTGSFAPISTAPRSEGSLPSRNPPCIFLR